MNDCRCLAQPKYIQISHIYIYGITDRKIYIYTILYADMKLAGRGMLVPPWLKEPTAADLFEPLMQE